MEDGLKELAADLRRYPRVKVDWLVTIEIGNRLYHRQTMDLSPVGAKVRLDEPLNVGSNAKLHIQPPHGNSLDVNALVWRVDADGPAFFFVDVNGEEVPATS